MTDKFEDLLRRWLRDRAGTDRSTLQALAGNVAVLPPRRQRRSPGLAVIALLLALVVAALFLALRSAPAATTQPAGPGPTATLEATPAWVSDLAGQLECDGAVANIGGEFPTLGERPESLGDDPEIALAVFLGPSNPYASLPAGGYTRLHGDGSWASFGHVVDGRIKAIVLLGQPVVYGPGWTVVGLRACDASEFDPGVPLTFPVTIWTDVSGTRVSTDTIRSVAGPEHCGWHTAIWLKVGAALYFRDPQGVMAEWTATTFEPDAQLPETAVDTGYRSGEWALWLDPGKDAYLVSAGHAERWPRSSDPQIGCM